MKIYSDNNVGESPLSSQGCSQLIRVISESQVCPINALMRMRLLVRFIFSLSTVFLQDPFYPQLYPDHYDDVVGDN